MTLPGYHDTMDISSQTSRFIAAHRNQDVRDLALSAKRVDGLDLPFALDQIAGWQTACRKLPQWAETDGIVYPPHISMEQCSSQFAAQYKAGIARRVAGAGGAMVDLTGGFGVDCSYIARGFSRAVYVERQPHLCELAAHNFRALGLPHMDVINGDAEDWLRGVVDSRAASADSAAVDSATAVPIALIYLDPARRDAHGGRTYAIADCTPDVLALKDRLLAVSPHVMVKLSPMLDWRKTVADFNGSVGEVHIVSTGNECKDLLLVLDRGSHDAVRVICVNDGDVFGYVHDMKTGADSDGVVLASAGEKGSQGGSAEPSHAAPEQPRYLYEPNASLMKGGCFALLEDHYGMRQIGPNSHLLISGTPAPQFPGRGFVIETIAGMGKKELKRALAGVDRANIAVRNFPLTAVQLRRKLKLADGGDVYLFGTTSVDGRHVIVRTVKQ